MDFKFPKFRDQTAGQSQIDGIGLFYNTVGVKSAMTSKVIKSHFYSLGFIDEKPNMK